MSMAFSPEDGAYLATCSKDATAKLWDPVSRTCVHLFRHQGDVRSVVFSPNGKFLATASKGVCAVKVWKIPMVTSDDDDDDATQKLPAVIVIDDDDDDDIPRPVALPSATDGDAMPVVVDDTIDNTASATASPRPATLPAATDDDAMPVVVDDTIDNTASATASPHPAALPAATDDDASQVVPAGTTDIATTSTTTASATATPRPAALPPTTSVARTSRPSARKTDTPKKPKKEDETPKKRKRPTTDTPVVVEDLENDDLITIIKTLGPKYNYFVSALENEYCGINGKYLATLSSDDRKQVFNELGVEGFTAQSLLEFHLGLKST